MHRMVLPLHHVSYAHVSWLVPSYLGCYHVAVTRNHPLRYHPFVHCFPFCLMSCHPVYLTHPFLSFHLSASSLILPVLINLPSSLPWPLLLCVFPWLWESKMETFLLSQKLTRLSPCRGCAWNYFWINGKSADIKAAQWFVPTNQTSEASTSMKVSMWDTVFCIIVCWQFGQIPFTMIEWCKKKINHGVKLRYLPCSITAVLKQYIQHQPDGN